MNIKNKLFTGAAIVGLSYFGIEGINHNSRTEECVTKSTISENSNSGKIDKETSLGLSAIRREICVNLTGKGDRVALKGSYNEGKLQEPEKNSQGIKYLIKNSFEIKPQLLNKSANILPDLIKGTVQDEYSNLRQQPKLRYFDITAQYPDSKNGFESGNNRLIIEGDKSLLDSLFNRTRCEKIVSPNECNSKRTIDYSYPGV